MNIKDLGKMPKRKVTVAEVLRLDAINDIIGYLEERKVDIGLVVVGIQWRGGAATWLTSMATNKDVLWLLEQIKHQLLQEANDG